MKINHYPVVDGYHSLGFLKESYPEIKWINCFISPAYRFDADALKREIDAGLQQKKSIAIVVWDESIIFPVVHEFVNLLNSYQLDPLWLVTQLDSESQLIYSFQHNIKCKIIELPWWWLNDTLCYYNMSRYYSNQMCSAGANYLCMVGRIAPHKLNLIRMLEKYKVDQFGVITLPRLLGEFINNRYVTINPRLPYQQSVASDSQMAARANYNDTWISANVQNFLYIEEKYNNIPLVVHSETTTGIFFNTEKSLWPVLLGKMMLIHGKPRVTKYVQRFYDFDMAQYANLGFDDILDHSEEAHQERVDRLVRDNLDLIQNSHDIYRNYKAELEAARWTIGKNLLDFCNKQVAKILV